MGNLFGAGWEGTLAYGEPWICEGLMKKQAWLWLTWALNQGIMNLNVWLKIFFELSYKLLCLFWHICGIKSILFKNEDSAGYFCEKIFLNGCTSMAT